MFTPFPCHEPRIHTASPSWAMCTSSLIFQSLNFHVLISSVQESTGPKGMISVFCSLNWAVAAWQKRSRHFWSSFGSSSWLRNIVVSSAYTLTSTLFSLLFTLNPFRGEFQIFLISGSIARLYSRHDIGSPWCTPLLTPGDLLVISIQLS
jgi:hypothetical protein